MSIYIVNCVLGIFLLVSQLIANAVFLANVIQFGVDQLNDSPSGDSFLFVHWFLFTLYIGISFGKLVWSSVSVTSFISSTNTISSYSQILNQKEDNLNYALSHI